MGQHRSWLEIHVCGLKFEETASPHFPSGYGMAAGTGARITAPGENKQQNIKQNAEL
jgi:hypothetical protein